MDTAAAECGAIAAGLLIGTAARYRLTINEGKPLRWRGVFAEMLLLGLIAIAIVIADSLDLTGNARVLVGTLAGESSERIVRLVRDRFMSRAEGEVGRIAPLPEPCEAA